MNVLKSIFILNLFLFFFVNFLNSMQEHINYDACQKLIVSVSVADFIENSQDMEKFEAVFSSQLLFNDKLFLVLDCENGWLCVDCIEQQEFCEDRFEFRRGFVRKDQVKEVEKFETRNAVTRKQWVKVIDSNAKPIMYISIGTKFKANIVKSGGSLDAFVCILLPDGRKGFIFLSDVRFFIDFFEFDEDDMRDGVCIVAKTFLNTHYCLDGRSADKLLFRRSVSKQRFGIFDVTQITGVGFSGLINLIYRANGFEIPSDVIGLFYNSNERQKGSDLKKGDLIFIEHEENDKKKTCVFLYLGNDEMIVVDKKKDAYVFGICSVSAFFGTSIENMENEQIYNNRKVYFRSFLNNPKTIQSMRNFFLFGGISDEIILRDRAATI